MPHPVYPADMIEAPAETKVVLDLYIAGMSNRSLRAVERVSRLCQRYLPGRFSLQIVDIYVQPDRAEAAQVIATPTLVRSRPTPLRQVVGDMSDEGRLLVALGVRGAA